MADSYVEESLIDLSEKKYEEVLEEEQRNPNFGSYDVVNEHPEAIYYENQPHSSLESDRNSASSVLRDISIASDIETQFSIRNIESNFDIKTSKPLVGAQKRNYEATEESSANILLVPIPVSTGDFSNYNPRSIFFENSSRHNVGKSNRGKVEKRRPRNVSFEAEDSSHRKREKKAGESLPRGKPTKSVSKSPPQTLKDTDTNESSAQTAEDCREISSSSVMFPQRNHMPSVDVATESAEAVSAGRQSGIQTPSHQAVKETFKCDVCGKTFGRKSYLDDHSKKHSVDKPFECKECGRGFDKKTNLTRHLLTHTKEKPFKCKECGREFARQDSLTRHLRTHTEEKTFKCKECGRGFARQDYLTMHLWTHSEEKPFKCKECDRSFSQSNNYRRHLKQVHNRN